MNKSLGLTFVEIMITLVIAAMIMVLGISMMTGYFPKQHLISTVQELENLIQKVQMEATRKAAWTCIRFCSPNSMVSFVNTSGSPGEANGCGDASSCDQNAKDTLITNKMMFRGRVEIANCTGNIKERCEIWFDPKGTPKRCDNSGCGGSDPKTCVDWDYEIVLSSPALDKGTRSKEIELTKAGLVQTVKIGEKGVLPTLWAQTGELSGGCE